MIGLKFRGRPPIKLAETVRDVATLRNEYAVSIMNRNAYLDDECIAAIMGQSVMSWEGRNPAPALDQDGNFQGTDLDLLSFLMPIADRRAVIEISRYQNRRQIVRRADERKIGTNQFGAVTGLVSNKDVFSFSVRMQDQTIVTRAAGGERTGKPRTYMIVDCDGSWYSGWDRIIWDPSAQENQFLTEKGLWTGNTVQFQYYVHPNRWQSIFGAPYLLQKMLICRLDDEAKFYKAEEERLKAMGIRFPTRSGLYIAESSAPDTQVTKSNTRSIKIDTMEMVLDIPEFSGNYIPAADTSGGLQYAANRHKFLTYTVKPFIQFCVRANETAYFFYGKSQIAYWMGNRAWVPNWRTPRGRIAWNLLHLSYDMALRYRLWIKTEQVSAE